LVENRGVEATQVYNTAKTLNSNPVDDATFDEMKNKFLGYIPKEVAPNTFVSSHSVDVNGDMIFTMVSQDGDVARLSLVRRSSSGGWNGWEEIPDSGVEVIVNDDLCTRKSTMQELIDENETLHPTE